SMANHGARSPSSYGTLLARQTPWLLPAALRSRPAIQRIDLGPGDRLFDPVEVTVKQFLSLRAGDGCTSAIDRCHGNLCGHQRAHCSGGVFVFGDGHGWLLSTDSDRRSNAYSRLRSHELSPAIGPVPVLQWVSPVVTIIVLFPLTGVAGTRSGC